MWYWINNEIFHTVKTLGQGGFNPELNKKFTDELIYTHDDHWVQKFSVKY